MNEEALRETVGEAMTPQLDEAGLDKAARALNTAGWTCHDGTDEPGRYDECQECRTAADRVAIFAITAYLTGRREGCV